MPLRVAYFVDTHAFGGAEGIVADLCDEALRRGDQPLLLHFGHEELVARVRAAGGRELQLPHQRSYKSIWTVPRFARSLRAILRAEQVDVLHSHLFGSVFAGALACALSPVRHVGTLHDSYTFADRPLLAYMVKAAQLLGTRVVAVSTSVREAVESRVMVSGRRIRVIQNGVAVPKPPTLEDRERIRASLGVDPNEVLVCTVARLVPIKGIHVLLDAWARLPSRGQARLVVVGEGPERATLEALATSLGIAGSVSFLGFRRDVSDILFASDVFVLPSFSEGLSCSLLEAMARGVACLATRVGGNPDLLVDGVHGALVEPGRPDALSEALSGLLSTPPRRLEFGRSSRERVANEFSSRATYDGYWALYGTGQ